MAAKKISFAAQCDKLEYLMGVLSGSDVANF